MNEQVSKKRVADAKDVLQKFRGRLEEGANSAELRTLCEMAELLKFREPIEKAVKDNDYTELYLLWSEIIRNKSTFGLLDLAHLLPVDGTLPHDEYNHHLRPLHDEMRRASPRVFQTIHWDGFEFRYEYCLRSVAHAARSAASPASGDGAAEFGRLKALLDLVVTAHRSGGESEKEPAAVGEWRHAVARQARALAEISLCRKDDSFAPFPAETDGAAAVRADDARLAQEDDLARLLLCVVNDSPMPEGAGVNGNLSLRPLAERIAEGGRCEGVATVDDIERLLNHHAFESGLARRLLNYRPWKPAPDFRPAIESVGGLELKVMMMGPVAVGKSSFLFSSEDYMTKEDKTLNFAIESLDGDDKNIEAARQSWKQGEHSKTPNINMAAKAGPRGLCGFHIVDTQGEFVTQGEEPGRYYNILRGHVSLFPDPSVFLLMLSMDPKEKKEHRTTDGRIAGILETCFSSPGKKKEGNNTLVYVVFNKFDAYLKSLQDNDGDHNQLHDLAREVGGRTFRLSPYLNRPAEEEKSWDSVYENARDSMRNHDCLGTWDDTGTRCSPAARRIVIDEAFHEWPTVFRSLSECRVRDIRLCFVSSTCGEREDITPAFSPGVKAFWSDLRSGIGIFQKALEKAAHGAFVKRLRKNAEAVLALESRLALDMKSAPIHGETGFSLSKPFASGNPFAQKRLDSEGRDLAERVSRRGVKSVELSDVGDSLRRLCQSEGCEELLRVLKWGDAGATAVRAFFESKWRDALRRVIGELNTVDIECMGFDAGEGSAREDRTGKGNETTNSDEHDSKEEKTSENRKEKREEWLARKRLDPSDLHGYKGLSRGPSLASDRRQWQILSSESRKWLLATNGAKKLWQAIEWDIDDGSLKGRSSLEPLSEAAEEALWHVADHTPEGPRTNWLPDYSCFAPRRGWGSDRLLVLALVDREIETEGRIAQVIEMVRSLAEIRWKIAGLSEEISALAERVVASRLLEGMGFDIEKIEAIHGAVKDAQEKVSEAAGGTKIGLNFFKQRQAILAECTGALNNKKLRLPERSITLLRPRSDGLDDANRKLKFLTLVAEAAGAGSESKQVTDGKIRLRCAELNKLSKEHRRKVSAYVRSTLGLLLDVHRCWLEKAVDLDGHETSVLKARCARITSSTEAEYKELRETLDCALKCFSEVVAKRSPISSGRGTGNE